MKYNMIFTKIARFIFLLVLVNVIGYIASAYMTDDTMVWYQALPHSPLNPPNYVFSIVWSILLFLQAIAAYLVWGPKCTHIKPSIYNHDTSAGTSNIGENSQLNLLKICKTGNKRYIYLIPKNFQAA